MNNIANGEPKESRGKIIKKDIYVIKNNINNKVYIGQTVNPRIRFNAHKNAARKNSPLLIQQGKANTLDNYSYPLRKVIRLGNKGLSKIEILKIIELLKQKPPLSEREISRKLNINRSTIRGIKNGTIKAYIIENQKYPIR